MTTMTPAVRDALAAEARRAGIVDVGALDLGETLGLLAAVRTDAAGNVTGAAEAIRTFKIAKPHFFAAPPATLAMNADEYATAKSAMLGGIQQEQFRQRTEAAAARAMNRSAGK